MKSKVVWFVLAVLLVAASVPVHCSAGPAGRHKLPPLDVSLMAFKEAGIWYFLCTAPMYCQRIPPHYQTYAPPPPPCYPPPCLGPPPAPVKLAPHRPPGR